MNDPRENVWQAFSQRLFDQNKFAIKLGLDNMRRAFAACGHPERSAPAIVVGGTNGKGTTASMTAAILQAHGLVVGLYTSPHLIEVRERFRVDGAPLARDEVLAEGRAVLDEFGDPDTSDPCLTFFELTTLMAARLFARHEVNVAIYEVGLGGRLDAVNAIEPSLTIITTIGFDHQQYLGDTIEEIAREKAALLRDGVTAIIAPQEYPQAKKSLEAAAGGRHRFVADDGLSKHHRVALESAQAFLGERFDAATAEDGLEHWAWPGRFDIRRVEHAGRSLKVIFDAAHNHDGMRFLADRLDERPRGLIFAAMADKVGDKLIAEIRRLAVDEVWVARLETDRAAAAEMLSKRLDARIATAEDALDQAFGELHEGDTLLVCGSVYLLGEVFAALGFSADQMVTWR